MLELIILIILVALAFDFINGFHDAANSIATVVSTRVLPPRVAVMWAAFFNFVAAFGLGVNVAKTVGKGVVDPAVVNEYVILAGLIGAIIWDLITWYYGLPSSSSHALIGGFVGAALVAGGPRAIIIAGISKIAAFMIISPLLGISLGFVMMAVTMRIVRNSSVAKVDRVFRRMQLASSSLVSLGHGTNDAQKTMGIISALLFSTGYLGAAFYVPYWVIFMAGTAMALGTFAGGWRIVKTIGMKITNLKPIGGFCAETAGAITIIGTAIGGIPISTTHTIAGSILGVGSTRRFSAVRWGIARNMIWAWIMTIPASALIATAAYALFQSVGLVH